MAWVIDLILKSILKALTEFLSGVVDTLSEILDNIFKISQMIVQGDFVSTITNYCFKLGLALLTFFAIAQIIKLYILPDSGDPEDDMNGFFIRVGKSAILLCFSTVICSMIVQFTNFISDDVLSAISGNVQGSAISALFKNEITSLVDSTLGGAIGIILIILASIICLLIISIQAGIRGVNLAILQMTAPIFAVNYITTDKGLWNKWLQNMMSVSLTYTFQVVLTNIALKFFALGFQSTIYPLIGICWLIVTIQSPKVLKEFAYSTGVGQGASKMSSMAYHAVRLLKH